MNTTDAAKSFDSIQKQSTASRQSQKNFLKSLSGSINHPTPYPRINSSPIQKPSTTNSSSCMIIENNSFVCSYSIKSSNKIAQKSSVINTQHSKSILGDASLESLQLTEIQVKCLNSQHLSDLNLSQIPGLLDLPIRASSNIKMKTVFNLKQRALKFCQKNNLQKSTFIIILINFDKSILQFYLTEETISDYLWAIIFISAKANEDCAGCGPLLLKKLANQSGMNADKLKEIEAEVYSRMSCVVLPTEYEYKMYLQFAKAYI